ncbi:class I SAM-dependent methyltransferase [bacterium]|nr:class I SAM-dependent methyltransferase [candidate division CSSED10-310 bacterium]
MIYDKTARDKALDELAKRGPAPTHLATARLTGSNKNVLELGCATGYVSQLMRQNNCTVTGIELDPEAAAEASKHCQRVIVGDLNETSLLNSLDQTYDVIVAGDILEHLIDPETILDTLHDHLKPGGYILVSMPNIAFWRMRLDLLMGRFEYQEFGLLDKTHLRFYTVKTFYALARKTGYDVQHTHINDAGFPLSGLLSKLPVFGKWVRTAALKLAYVFPNVFAFHTIYQLAPSRRTSEEDTHVAGTQNR